MGKIQWCSFENQNDSIYKVNDQVILCFTIRKFQFTLSYKGGGAIMVPPITNWHSVSTWLIQAGIQSLLDTKSNYWVFHSKSFILRRLKITFKSIEYIDKRSFHNYKANIYVHNSPPFLGHLKWKDVDLKNLLFKVMLVCLIWSHVNVCFVIIKTSFIYMFNRFKCYFKPSQNKRFRMEHPAVGLGVQ